MRVEVNISDSVLNWIFNCIHIDVLPSQIVEYLKDWRSGEKKPTFSQIERTSKATGIPLGYFFLDTPPKEDLSLTEYRTIDSIEMQNPSRELIDTIHDMEQIQQWMKEYLASIGAEPVPYVASMRKQDVQQFASSIREILGVTVEWYSKFSNSSECFRFIRSAISNSGTIVMMNGVVGANTHRPLRTKEFRAFAMVDQYAPLIFINANDTVAARLFSLLHEFAHVCIGENSLFNDYGESGHALRKTEIACNAVAAEFLVPLSIFRNKWTTGILSYDIDYTVSQLASYFRCSKTVIARRALDCGYITSDQYHRIATQTAKQAEEAKKEKNPGGDYYRTVSSRIDNRFLGLLTESTLQGRTLYSDAFRLTHTNRSTFAKLTSGGELHG